MSEKPEALNEGELWSWVRSVMSQGADIRVDYDMGNHAGYEAYSARLDAAAAERQQEFWFARVAPSLAEIERLSAEVERLAKSRDAAIELANQRHDKAVAARAEVGRLRASLSMAADVAHCGGLAEPAGLDEGAALTIVRRLTLPHWDRSGSLHDLKKRVRAAIDAARKIAT